MRVAYSVNVAAVAESVVPSWPHCHHQYTPAQPQVGLPGRILVLDKIVAAAVAAGRDIRWAEADSEDLSLTVVAGSVAVGPRAPMSWPD